MGNVGEYTLFKTTLNACISYLPKISRRLERINVFLSIISDNSVLKTGELNHNSLVAQTIYECIRMLRHSHSIRVGQNFCDVVENDFSQMKSKKSNKNLINATTRYEKY